jgi:hypothetical protein
LRANAKSTMSDPFELRISQPFYSEPQPSYSGAADAATLPAPRPAFEAAAVLAEQPAGAGDDAPAAEDRSFEQEQDVAQNTAQKTALSYAALPVPVIEPVPAGLVATSPPLNARGAAGRRDAGALFASERSSNTGPAPQQRPVLTKAPRPLGNGRAPLAAQALAPSSQPGRPPSPSALSPARDDNVEVQQAIYRTARDGVANTLGFAAGLETTAFFGPLVGLPTGAATAATAGSAIDFVADSVQAHGGLSPRVETQKSLGGLFGSLLRFEPTSPRKVSDAVFGTFTDGVNGAFATSGVLASRGVQRLAQLGAEDVAAASSTFIQAGPGQFLEVGMFQVPRAPNPVQLGRGAAATTAFNSALQGGVNFASERLRASYDPTFTKAERRLAASQSPQALPRFLVNQIALPALSSFVGVAALAQPRSLDVANQLLNGFVTGLAQSVAGNLFDGKKLGPSSAQVAAAAAGAAPRAAFNAAQRLPATLEES